MRCLVASCNVHHHGGWKKYALARFTQPLPHKGRSPLSYMARVPFFCRLARIAATAIRERDSAFFERRRPRARGLAASEARRRGEERGGEGEGNFAVSLTGEKMAGGRASDKRDERDGEQAAVFALPAQYGRDGPSSCDSCTGRGSPKTESIS